MFKNFINKELNEIVKKLKQHKTSYIFLEPIENIINLYIDYKDKIKEPIDLNLIQKRVDEKYYNSTEQFKNDVYLMCDNCKEYNKNSINYYSAACNLIDYFNNNFKRIEAKINKQIEKAKEQNIKQKIIDAHSKSNNYRSKNINNSMRSNVIPNYKQYSNSLYSSNVNYKGKNNTILLDSEEEEKIYHKIYNLFFKIINELNADEEKIEEIACYISKSIIRKSQPYDIIYNETILFLNTYLKNNENKEFKSKFLKKYRKIIKAIKEEHNTNNNKGIAKLNLILNEDNNIKMNIVNSTEYKETIEKCSILLNDFLEIQEKPDNLDVDFFINKNLKNQIKNYYNNAINTIFIPKTNNMAKDKLLNKKYFLNSNFLINKYQYRNEYMYESEQDV